MFDDYKLNNKELRYEKFCIPVLLDLSSVPNNSYSLVKIANLRYAGDLRFLITHIQKNLKYCNQDIIGSYQELLSEITSAKRYYETNEKKYEQNAINAEIHFSRIILAILKDSSAIAKELELPNIAQPLLSSFADRNYSYTDL